MVRKLNEKYIKVEMELNFSKSEYLKMTDQEVKDIEIFKYLGFLISKKNQDWLSVYKTK